MSNTSTLGRTEGEILEKAADAVERLGLAKSALRRRNGSICTLSSLYVGLDPNIHIPADSQNPENLDHKAHPTRQAAEDRVARALGGDSHHFICEWNNREGRTIEDVTTLLRQAAADARAEGS